MSAIAVVRLNLWCCTQGCGKLRAFDDKRVETYCWECGKPMYMLYGPAPQDEYYVHNPEFELFAELIKK